MSSQASSQVAGSKIWSSQVTRSKFWSSQVAIKSSQVINSSHQVKSSSQVIKSSHQVKSSSQVIKSSGLPTPTLEAETMAMMDVYVHDGRHR